MLTRFGSLVTCPLWSMRCVEPGVPLWPPLTPRGGANWPSHGMTTCTGFCSAVYVTSCAGAPRWRPAPAESPTSPSDSTRNGCLSSSISTLSRYIKPDRDCIIHPAVGGRACRTAIGREHHAVDVSRVVAPVILAGEHGHAGAEPGAAFGEPVSLAKPRERRLRDIHQPLGDVGGGGRAA